MYKNATKCNETIGKWCKNKHGASKIIDTFETYQGAQGQPKNTTPLATTAGRRGNQGGSGSIETAQILLKEQR
jgi:hypothetical protein